MWGRGVDIPDVSAAGGRTCTPSQPHDNGAENQGGKTRNGRAPGPGWTTGDVLWALDHVPTADLRAQWLRAYESYQPIRCIGPIT